MNIHERQYVKLCTDILKEKAKYEIVDEFLLFIDSITGILDGKIFTYFYIQYPEMESICQVLYLLTTGVYYPPVAIDDENIALKRLKYSYGDILK